MGHVIGEGWTNSASKCRLGCRECQYLGHVIGEGWTNSASKCRLGCRECQYLGHIIGNGRVRPEQNKIKALQNFEQPKKKKDVRAFLGLADYYRKFILRFSETVIPLTDATKKDAPDKLQWTSSMEAAFQQLKQQLLSDIVLASPNEECPFMLQTVVSTVGRAGILSQADNSGDDRPIAYFSRKLLPREQHYSAVELEYLAIISSVQHFRVYLPGMEFTVQTDHKIPSSPQGSRLTRWGSGSTTIRLQSAASTRKGQYRRSQQTSLDGRF